jgi:hypothetical protein
MALYQDIGGEGCAGISFREDNPGWHGGENVHGTTRLLAIRSHRRPAGQGCEAARLQGSRSEIEPIVCGKWGCCLLSQLSTSRVNQESALKSTNKVQHLVQTINDNHLVKFDTHSVT